MQVTPVKKKFGKHSPGDVFELRDKTAKILIAVGKLAPAGYITRDMRAQHPQAPAVIMDAVPVIAVADPVAAKADEEAPYGYKADGAPRKRPGRPSASE